MAHAVLRQRNKAQAALHQNMSQPACLRVQVVSGQADAQGELKEKGMYADGVQWLAMKAYH